LLLKKFRAPKKSLGALDAEATGELIAASADIALIIDRKGIIRDIAFGSEELCADLPGGWVGKPWSDTVTVESRPRVEGLLQDAASGERRSRQVNHAAIRGPDVPILYSAIKAGTEGRVVAMGRDLRLIETLQQRLMSVEQSAEKELARLRHAEIRYRLMFQVADEAVLIVDSATGKVTEANPAASQILGAGTRRLVGRSFPEGFDAQGSRDIATLLAALRTSGRGDEARARLTASGAEFAVCAWLFRQHDASHFLLRLRPLSTAAAAGGAVPTPTQSLLLEVLEKSPDGLVVTGADGNILAANRAFLDLAQLATAEQVRGEPLDRWLGRPGVDMRVLIGNLRQHGMVRLFATTLRGEYGSSCDVEVSAVLVANHEESCLGFTVRNVGQRSGVDLKATRELPRSAKELTELIGRVSLKELVRETTDVIERLCIEAALRLTGDNRASAAEMLGLSRQSLYAKLRRYGMGALDSDED
jgi:transcriptional regulator PpsR